MSDVRNPRLHAEPLATLAAVSVPTTKILAIGLVTAKGTPGAIAPVLSSEVRVMVRTCLEMGAERILARRTADVRFVLPRASGYACVAYFIVASIAQKL